MRIASPPATREEVDSSANAPTTVVYTPTAANTHSNHVTGQEDNHGSPPVAIRIPQIDEEEKPKSHHFPLIVGDDAVSDYGTPPEDPSRVSDTYSSSNYGTPPPPPPPQSAVASYVPSVILEVLSAAALALRLTSGNGDSPPEDATPGKMSSRTPSSSDTSSRKNTADEFPSSDHSFDIPTAQEAPMSNDSFSDGHTGEGPFGNISPGCSSTNSTLSGNSSLSTTTPGDGSQCDIPTSATSLDLKIPQNATTGESSVLSDVENGCSPLGVTSPENTAVTGTQLHDTSVGKHLLRDPPAATELLDAAESEPGYDTVDKSTGASESERSWAQDTSNAHDKKEYHINTEDHHHYTGVVPHPPDQEHQPLLNDNVASDYRNSTAHQTPQHHHTITGPHVIAEAVADCEKVTDHTDTELCFENKAFLSDSLKRQLSSEIGSVSVVVSNSARQASPDEPDNFRPIPDLDLQSVPGVPFGDLTPATAVVPIPATPPNSLEPSSTSLTTDGEDTQSSHVQDSAECDPLVQQTETRNGDTVPDSCSDVTPVQEADTKCNLLVSNKHEGLTASDVAQDQQDHAEPVSSCPRSKASRRPGDQWILVHSTSDLQDHDTDCGSQCLKPSLTSNGQPSTQDVPKAHQHHPDVSRSTEAPANEVSRERRGWCRARGYPVGTCFVTTFRRREPGLRRTVVAIVVANFIVSLASAGKLSVRLFVHLK